MLILIEKDPATRVPREVADIAEARALVAAGWVVLVPGAEPGEFVPLTDEPAAEAPAEAPAETPAEEPAKPAKKAKKPAEEPAADATE